MTDTTLHTSADEAAVTLTFDEAQALLERAVEEKGKDHTYAYHRDVMTNGPICLYFDPESKAPSCIVGHVLSYKGVTIDVVEKADANRMTDVDNLATKGIIKADDETLMLLLLAQSEQDMGQTWGDAVEEALATYQERLAARREYVGSLTSDDHDYDYNN